MVFKPFKSPLIRKIEPSAETGEDSDHPAKKARLQKNEPAHADTRPAPSLGSRKPLVQVRNGKDSGKASKKSAPKSGAGERYFNALWYAQSTLFFVIPNPMNRPRFNIRLRL